jgi:8-oxo-dGTP pyrophosphatase MutT (NUDIX family)
MPDLPEKQDEWTTWDGQAVSREPPHGASVVVYRRIDNAYEFLVLHRAGNGPDYEGDWAWTPPSGARYPGEPVDQCALRELREESGLSLTPKRTQFGSADWEVYIAEASPTDSVELDAEHDRFEWLAIEVAIARCKPKRVADSLRSVGDDLGAI